MLPPVHMVGLDGVMFSAGGLCTATDTVALPVQPLLLAPVTVYVVFDAGLAKGFAIFALLKPVAGVQV